VSLVTALFTGMSQAAHHGQSSLVARDVRRGMRLIALTMIPVAVASIALGTAATRILYPNLTVQATDSVGYVLWSMVLGLPGFGIYYLIQRAFYAYEDARTPFLLQVANTLISVAVTLACQWAPSEYRAVGIGFGQAVANTITAVIAIVLLRRRLGGLLLFDVIRTIVRVIVASLPAGLAAYAVFLVGQVLPDVHVPGLPTVHLGALVAVVAGGLLFLWMYATTARRMRLRELDDLLAPLVRRVRRFRPGSSGAV
jgi:putative peptidoglycan lipid II flippase